MWHACCVPHPPTQGDIMENYITLVLRKGDNGQAGIVSAYREREDAERACASLNLVWPGEYFPEDIRVCPPQVWPQY